MTAMKKSVKYHSPVPRVKHCVSGKLVKSPLIEIHVDLFALLKTDYKTTTTTNKTDRQAYKQIHEHEIPYTNIDSQKVKNSRTAF